MGKLRKRNEFSIGTSPYKKRERRRTLNHKQREVAIKRFENLINRTHRSLQPPVSPKISDKERKREKESLITDCNHDESIRDTDGFIICTRCGDKIMEIKIKKKSKKIGTHNARNKKRNIN